MYTVVVKPRIVTLDYNQAWHVVNNPWIAGDDCSVVLHDEAKNGRFLFELFFSHRPSSLKMQIAFKLNPLNARKHPAWFEALKVTTFFYRVNDYLDAYKDIAKASSQTDEDLLDAIGKIPIQDWDDGMDQKVVLDLQKRNYNFNGPKDFIRSNRNYTLHSAVSETAFQVIFGFFGF